MAINLEPLYKITISVILLLCITIFFYLAFALEKMQYKFNWKMINIENIYYKIQISENLQDEAGIARITYLNNLKL